MAHFCSIDIVQHSLPILDTISCVQRIDLTLFGAFIFYIYYFFLPLSLVLLVRSFFLITLIRNESHLAISKLCIVLQHFFSLGNNLKGR